MSEYLADTRGCFPSKAALVSALSLGRLSSDLLLHEWRTQIRHCVNLGLRLEFVNSHEHVHMFPGLYSKACTLAHEHGIPYVRAPATEFLPRLTVEGTLRSLAMAIARTFAPATEPAQPILIGLNSSGRLDTAYCRWRFPRLAPGRAYELMCHPGRADPLAAADPRLRKYHDWEGELALLTSREFTDVLRANHIAVTSFAQLYRPLAKDARDAAPS
jgi:predicted glycoside hydrolase/deacetylase ChbG (UPF0249 family)